MKVSPLLIDEDTAGDPELEAAARAEREKQSPQKLESEEEDDEDDWTPKDAAAVAKKEKQMAKRGFVFQSKMAASGKVRLMTCPMIRKGNCYVSCTRWYFRTLFS